LEGFLGLRIKKGMQHGDRAIELLLCGRTARNVEVNLAEVSAEVVSGMFVLTLQKGKGSGKNQGQQRPQHHGLFTTITPISKSFESYGN
jgi:hypothetical protein